MTENLEKKIFQNDFYQSENEYSSENSDILDSDDSTTDHVTSSTNKNDIKNLIYAIKRKVSETNFEKDHVSNKNSINKNMSRDVVVPKKRRNLKESALPISTKATQLLAQQENHDIGTYKHNNYRGDNTTKNNNTERLDILDTSIISGKNITSAKKKNKEIRNKRRLGPDEINKSSTTLEDPPDIEIDGNKTKSNYYDFLRTILMLDNRKEYDLFDALNNTNAGITFAQLFAVSPLLRRLCIKGLKLNPNDIRKINSVHHVNINENDSDFLINIFKNINSEPSDDSKAHQDPVENPKDNIKRINVLGKAGIASVIGSVDKNMVKVLVDTGSEANVITTSFFKIIAKNHKVLKLERNYFKVAGKQIISSDQVVHLCLKFENLDINVPFYILDDDDTSYDIIIGRQVHKDYRLYIDPDDDALYKKTDSGPVLVAHPTDITIPGNRLYRISICNSTNELLTLSKRSDNDIELKNIDNKKLNNLINEYKDVLINSIDDVSVAKAEPHSIELTNNKPIKMRPYKTSLEQSNALKEEIIKLLKHGLIEPSHSPWSFPVILVRKKNGKWRMCVDYRRLNQITIKDAYALPFIDELLESVFGAKYFSAIDLFSGFHQIPMNPRDIEKTAFTTKYGNFNFKVMPFGLTNAPATFQREMNRILMPLIGVCLFVYMDDILVYSPTLEQHLKDLEKLFKILRDNKFSINIDKCSFCKHSVEVLGHMLTGEGIKPVPSKVLAIMSWDIPKDVSQLRSFLGLISYYRKFIPNFAGFSNCLYKLTSPKVPFVWTNIHSEAFENLKKAICSNSVLKYPDPNRPLIIRTDASSYAVGAVLLQIQDSSKLEFPIYCVSRCLKNAETRYSVTEKEGIAVIFALKKFRSYISASPFPVKLFTDHKPLVGFFYNSIPNKDRHFRWIAIFNEFRVDLIYDKGKNNVFADALSRIPSSQHLKINTIHSILSNDESNDVSSFAPPKILEYVKKNYSFYDGSLVFHDKSGKLLKVIEDEDVKSSLIRKAHLVGHEGVEKTLSRLKEAYYWPGMYKDIDKCVKSCLRCQCYRPKPITKNLSNIPTPVERPFVRVGLDIVGPLPITNKGNQYLIVLVDYTTKWVEAMPLKNIESQDVIYFLKDVFARHGVPEIIVTDNGPQFSSDITKTMIDLYGSWVQFVAPHHPEANGQVENRNREIIKILRHLCFNQENWDDYIPASLWALRTTRSSVTGFSSFELLYGRKDLWPLSVVISDINKAKNETNEEYNLRRFILHQKWVKEAMENIKKAHAYWSQRSKARDNMNHKYKPGDLVLVRYIGRKKLDPFFLGPYKVLKASKYNTLVLETIDTHKILERNIHIKNVKPYLVSI